MPAPEPPSLAADQAPASPRVRSVFRPSTGELQFDLDADAMRAARDDASGLLWVDVHVDGREQGDRILRDIFGFHALTIDDCYNTLIDPPKVDDFGDYLFVIVHAVSYDEAIGYLETQELNLYIGANYVVSVHRAPSHAVEVVRSRAESRTPVVNRGAAFLAHALMDIVVDDFQPVVEAIDAQVELLEERVIDTPSRETLQRILQMKRVTQRLRRTIAPQRDVVNRFSRGEYPRVIAADALMYFRDIYDHTVRVHETIESVRDLAESALSTYLSSVNNRINEVMRTLAVVTVIFLPLTLIAGIYGTNFANVPEYQTRFGYAAMLTAMVLIVVALLGWFRWRKWF